MIKIKVKAGSKFHEAMKKYQEEKKERFKKHFEQIKKIESGQDGNAPVC